MSKSKKQKEADARESAAILIEWGLLPGDRLVFTCVHRSRDGMTHGYRVALALPPFGGETRPHIQDVTYHITDNLRRELAKLDPRFADALSLRHDVY